LFQIVQGLNAIQEEHNTNIQIGMTTNGINLHKHLDTLVDAVMTSINSSLDTFNPIKFATLTRQAETYLYAVWKSIEKAVEKASEMNHNLHIKLNCAAMRGVNDDGIVDFVRLTTDTFYGSSIQVRFIES
jgi:cyclic pyranopterin phosphate synthase